MPFKQQLKKNKTFIKIGPPLAKFSGSAHEQQAYLIATVHKSCLFFFLIESDR